MNLLLDTCVFLWLCDHTEELSRPAREALENGANKLFFSQVSASKFKSNSAKASFPSPRTRYFFISEAVEKHGINFLPLENEAIWTTGKLPPHHHDPFDRLLIAHAILEGMILVTPDKKILPYPVRTLW